MDHPAGGRVAGWFESAASTLSLARWTDGVSEAVQFGDFPKCMRVQQMTDADQTIYQGAAEPSSSHTTSETPSWLMTPATSGGLPLPVQTHSQLLPLAQLGWDDFERICFRLLRTQVIGAVRAAIYGVPGQAQRGIDMYAVAAASPADASYTRPYVTLQSRRIINVTQANLEVSVGDFLEGKWADSSQKFIYATSSSVRPTQLLHKVEELATSLGQQSIAFEVWDQERISEMLKEHPELVNDFFGRSWVTAFCGADAALQMGNRLEPGRYCQTPWGTGAHIHQNIRLGRSGFRRFQVERSSAGRTAGSLCHPRPSLRGTSNCILSIQGGHGGRSGGPAT